MPTRRRNRGAVAAGEQGQSLVAKDEPAPALDPMGGEEVVPLQLGRQPGDSPAFDSDQRSQVVGPDPGPVADQVKGALLR